MGMDNQRWRCKNCNAITPGQELLTAPSPFDGCDTLTACPKCKQCSDGFDLLCDEAGCNEIAGCGSPTGDENDQWRGYRWTCYRHIRAARPGGTT